jgi:diguanylate cyclase (GGDEF)-like protein/PAS domain S-box-containing protein
MIMLGVVLVSLAALVLMFKRRFVEGDRRAALIVEFSRDAIVGVDSAGRITIWNRAAEQLYGYVRDEVVGRHVGLLVPPDRQGEEQETLDRMMRAEVLEDRAVERMRRDGSTRMISLSVSPVTDADGTVTGGAGIHRDITAEVLATERLALQAAMLDEVDAAVVVTNGDARTVTFWSAGAQRLFGYTADEMVGRSVDSLLDADQLLALDEMRRARGNGSQLEGELDAADSRGRVVPVYIRSRSVPSTPGRPTPEGTISVAVDISARREAQELTQRHIESQQEIAALGRLALRGESCERLFERAIEVAARVLGADEALLLERRPADGGLLVAARTPGTAAHEHASGQDSWLADHVLRTRRPTVVEDWEHEPRLRGARASAEDAPRSSAAVDVGDTDYPFGVLIVNYGGPGEIRPDCVPFLQALANVLADALLSREARAQIRRQGLHDPLTGLANRGLFRDRVEHALERSREDGGTLAVLMLDIDHFRIINESLGHDAGDDALCRLAPRLQCAIRPGDTLARLAGGEFAVLCERLPSREAAGHIADRMLAATREPMAIADGSHTFGACVGIALGRVGSSAGELVRDADSALSHAKSTGRGSYEMFETQMRARILDRVRLEGALRSALASEREIHVHYQALVSLRSGAIIGAEALARWTHPEWGPVSPGEFIPVAEESGAIHELGARVMRDSLAQAAAWSGVEGFQGIAVNVSPLQLADPPEVAELARDALAAAGLEPGFLTLEITEGVLIERLEGAEGALGLLADLGLRLSLDDFGTGYSSLSYLGQLPFDSVKIDRSLIRDVVGNPRAASLASAIVEMGHALGKVVIAEGVETVEQATLLQGIGCDVGQGFYFSKPISPSAFAELLRESPRFVPARADSLADTKVPAPQRIEGEGTASPVLAGGSVLPAGLLGQAAIGRGPA